MSVEADRAKQIALDLMDFFASRTLAVVTPKTEAAMRLRMALEINRADLEGAVIALTDIAKLEAGSATRHYLEHQLTELKNVLIRDGRLYRA